MRIFFWLSLFSSILLLLSRYKFVSWGPLVETKGGRSSSPLSPHSLSLLLFCLLLSSQLFPFIKRWEFESNSSTGKWETLARCILSFFLYFPPFILLSRICFTSCQGDLACFLEENVLLRLHCPQQGPTTPYQCSHPTHSKVSSRNVGTLRREPTYLMFFFFVFQLNTYAYSQR